MKKNSVELILEDLAELHKIKNQEYGDLLSKLEKILNVIMDGREIVLKDGKDWALMSFNLEILTKTLRAFEITYFRKDYDATDSLRDLIVYAAMVLDRMDKK